ncbi:hypothetical protein [Halalkalibacter oceani]|uniref:hypothetical protein n=1 Tax=Halalkalibacter oceani TaxID=1653776 RepID=UPI00339B5FD3
MKLTQSDLASLELDIGRMRRLGGVTAEPNAEYHSLLISRVEQLLIELKSKGDRYL